MRPSLIAATAATAALLALVPRASAQPPAEPGAFSEEVEVRVVNVEVVVTDRDGVPVRGLGVADFTLEVDGVETPIDYFSEIRGGQVLAGGGEGRLDLPSVPALVPGESVGTSYLVFVDDYFTFEDQRNRALDGIAADLGLLGPRDRMAIVAFDGRRAAMLSSWSGSAVELERALGEAKGRPAQGLQRLSELRQYERDAVVRPSTSGAGFELDPDTKAYVLRLADQVDRMIDGAAATLRGFAKPPGRKVMLLVGGGWPYSLLDFVGADLRARSELGIVDGDRLYRQLSDTANQLGYTLYAADVSGNGARWEEDPGAASRFEPGSATLALARRSERQYSSRYLARQTGGRALLLGDAERPFANAVADTRSYYWLGFSPDRGWDDRRHDLRVRTRDGELEVRSRRDFLDSSRSAEVTMSVESALIFGGLPEEAEMTVELGEWRKAGFRKMELPLTVSLPVDLLTFVPSGSGLVADLELRLAVEDETAQRAEIPVIPVRIETGGPPPPGQRWTYTVPLRLRRQEHRALVALYDLASGRIFTSEIRIAP
ncbi:MAG: VWA domain-containing protein [Acidobacteriota bacterium]|nr:VWA domain-containing protein [Acidobacteriota bacterium]MDH3524472.1 VWA domain-containing protein [Acidobacteriota bacterium]